MPRNVENEKIERGYYQAAINQRIRRTLRVAKTCFAATLVGAVIGGVTRESPAAAVFVPSALVAVVERKRSTGAMDDLVSEYASSIDSTSSAYVGEKAIIHKGKLHSVRYIDAGAAMSDLSYIGLEQTGGTLAGLIGGSIAAGHTPEAARPGALMVTSALGLAAAGGLFMDSYSLRESYSARLENVEGVSGIES
jgi:hypothetical protein